MNKVKNQKGFSLIELMVVVAIIGILSAVAVPQFQKFQRKAKQSEARANLSAIYTSQKTFYAETGTYYTNLWATGYEPEGVMLYTYGFTTSSAANAPGYTTGAYIRTLYNASNNICLGAFGAGAGQNCMYQAGHPYAPNVTAWTASSSAFAVGARVRSSVLGGATEDRWQMDHRKELVNLMNGAL